MEAGEGYYFDQRKVDAGVPREEEGKRFLELRVQDWHGAMLNSSTIIAITNPVYMQMAQCIYTALLITVLEFWISKEKSL